MGDCERADAEVIFLLGAGVSIPVGIPAMQGMFTSFLEKSKSGITADDKRMCEFFVEELGVQKDLEEFLLAANAVSDFPQTSTKHLVERSISPRKDARSIRDYRERLAKYASRAAGVRTRILQYMSRTCFQFDRTKAMTIFKPFVAALADKAYPVYTTNYDFVLEYVAEQTSVAIHDNFVLDGQRLLWNPAIEFDCGDGLTIVKLHGSVTWYSNKDRVIEKLYTFTDLNTIGENVDRLVIAPTRFKDIYDQHFFALYSHFLSALSSASVLVVAGHSLRDDYLRAAIVERCRKGGFSLIVIAPTFPALLAKEVTPERLGTSGPVVHVPLRFEEFAHELASIVEKSPPAEFAQACADVVHQVRVCSNKLTIKGNIGGLKAGATKELTASIDAYLGVGDKPARVRVWLEADLTKADGQRTHERSAKFLEIQPLEIGQEWTGVVRSDESVSFKVPTYAEWIERAAKVKLRVAVVKRSVKTPIQVTEHNIIAEGHRDLTYTS